MAKQMPPHKWPNAILQWHACLVKEQKKEMQRPP